jgi:hypothetical protein
VDYKQENAVELDQIKQSSNVLNTAERGPSGEVIHRLSPLWTQVTDKVQTCRILYKDMEWVNRNNFRNPRWQKIVSQLYKIKKEKKKINAFPTLIFMKIIVIK